jgi:hypothetical protein
VTHQSPYLDRPVPSATRHVLCIPLVDQFSDPPRFCTMQKACLLLFNKILYMHRSYLCARFPISEIPRVAWGDFRPDPVDFGAKIGQVKRSGQIYGKARWHPDNFLSRSTTHLARDGKKYAFYLVTRRFSNTINQLNPQPTQSTMSSSEGEEFNMDVSGSESNYESEPKLKKVGRLPFDSFNGSVIFSTGIRESEDGTKTCQSKCRLQRLNRNPLQ